MNKKLARIRRSKKTRYILKRLHATRLVVYRSSKHIYAQIINHANKVLVSASTLEKDIKTKVNYSGNKYSAEVIGTIIAHRANQYGIKKISFDRSGFKYHGRIKALAEAARKNGLIF
ncbi:MAG: 50S ribosomal protein L18 [Candidatus Lightella neohaematopini]|nr:50S ribosomal protein L18 [Candidatus Lightella neohaematopini]MCV2528814.1 50S ribosomal protein L18 [Candidatus Lightella neohaematopini]